MELFGTYTQNILQQAVTSAQDFTLKQHPSVQKDQGKAQKTAQDFEAMFLSQMLQPMFSGLEADPLFGGGSAEETFRVMLVDEYGKAMAKTGGVGVAAHVQQTLLHAQEGGI